MDNKYSNLKIVQNFNESNLPDLDIVTLAALELFIKNGFPNFEIPKCVKPIVAGSGNARVTSEILFNDSDAVFVGESNYKQGAEHLGIDAGFVFSASGEKHAPLQTQVFLDKKIPTYLITCNSNSSAGKLKGIKKIIVTDKNREPYTYNTSTYLGWILAMTKENPKQIYDYINNEVKNKIPNNLKKYKGYLLITPDKFEKVNKLFEVKFIELFGRKIARDVKTYEQMKHAITVVQDEKELCIRFGTGNDVYFKNDILNIPLPKNASFGTMMAIGYYVIGQIQKQNIPYFKQSIQKYCKEGGLKAFRKEINPIVE